MSELFLHDETESLIVDVWQSCGQTGLNYYDASISRGLSDYNAAKFAIDAVNAGQDSDAIAEVLKQALTCADITS